jgi:hypothetical protein
MLEFLSALIKGIQVDNMGIHPTKNSGYTSELELFILKNRPSSIAEVEFLTREFDNQARNKTYRWIV